jgi:hypothetical protein
MLGVENHSSTMCQRLLTEFYKSEESAEGRIAASKVSSDMLRFTTVVNACRRTDFRETSK